MKLDWGLGRRPYPPLWVPSGPEPQHATTSHTPLLSNDFFFEIPGVIKIDSRFRDFFDLPRKLSEDRPDIRRSNFEDVRNSEDGGRSDAEKLSSFGSSNDAKVHSGEGCELHLVPSSGHSQFFQM